MVVFDKSKFLRVFMEAKMHAYITRSVLPEEEAKLEKLRAKMEEVMLLVDDVLGDTE
ncbi:hypothetical protein KKE60_08440 [Patescibacteria group bacterium]|nr:hypothetical protein [Patescibacteria group bacterium]